MGNLIVTVRQNNMLPKLCWVLEYKPESEHAEISVGNGVEIFQDAIVEGCWDGSFGEHEFSGKNLFGSAVRWLEDSLTIYGSISLTDRICYAVDSDRFVFSNSLFAVMATIDAYFDESVNYYKVSYAPLAGVENYPTEIPIAHERIGVVQQLFHRNIDLSVGGKIMISCKTEAEEFSCFSEYEKRISASVGNVVRNIESTERKHSVIPYVTLSSGYDSTAVAALAKDSGVIQALLCTKPRTKFFDLFGSRFVDDGTKAGKALGLNINYVNARDYNVDDDELLYISPSASTPEVSFLPMSKYLENQNTIGAVFTGNYGGIVWDRNISNKYVNDLLIRSDMAGINISEARLKSGFFNVSIPFLFARSAESIIAIGRSKEMSQWSIGGGYDRPIARRIAEERGVPRGSFGLRKRAIIDRYPEPRNSILAEDFRRFMKDQHGYGLYPFFLLKWRYFLSLTLGRKNKNLSVSSRSRNDLSYWLWFWAATKSIEYYKKLMFGNKQTKF